MARKCHLVAKYATKANFGIEVQAHCTTMISPQFLVTLLSWRQIAAAGLNSNGRADTQNLTKGCSSGSRQAIGNGKDKPLATENRQLTMVPL